MNTILIVDDNAGFRVQARALLEADGFDVVGEAADGISGLAAARTLRPDLVLLDIGLPDVEGFEVARELAVDGPPPVRRPDLEPRSRRLRTAPRRQPGPRVHPEGRAVGRGDPRVDPGA